MSISKSKLKLYSLVTVSVVALIGIFIYAKTSGMLQFMSSMEDLQKYIESFGEKAYIVFFIIQLISVIIAPIPSNISSVVGGAVFGMWESFLLSTIAIIGGSIIVFLLARKFGKPFVDRFVNPKISSKYEQLISSKRGEMLLMLMFFLPFFPDDALGFLVGLSKMSLRKYFIIILITRPWGILVSSAVGAKNILIPWWGWGIVSLFVIFIVKYGSKLEEKLISVVEGR